MPDPFNIATLPEDIRAEPSLASFKTVDDLAKSYVSSQKLIGTNRLPSPQPTWTDNEWNGLYQALGRPEKPEMYELPKDVKLREGITMDPEKLKGTWGELHKLGLNKKQAEGVMRYYMGTLNSTAEAEDAMRTQQVATGVEELRKTHGDKYDAVVGIAKGVLQKFSPDGFMDFLEKSGLANHPQMVGFLHKIGSVMSEDSMRGGGAPSIPVGDAGAATLELTKLEQDQEFQKAYHDRHHPSHKEAVDRILYLNRIAYPGKVQS